MKTCCDGDVWEPTNKSQTQTWVFGECLFPMIKHGGMQRWLTARERQCLQRVKENIIRDEPGLGKERDTRVCICRGGNGLTREVVWKKAN